MIALRFLSMYYFHEKILFEQVKLYQLATQQATKAARWVILQLKPHPQSIQMRRLIYELSYYARVLKRVGRAKR